MDDSKGELRKKLRDRRAVAFRENAQAPYALRDIFLSKITLSPDSLIAATIAQASEMDPAPLVKELFAKGYKLCLPCVVEKGQPLVFRSYCEGDNLRVGPSSIPEPPFSSPLVVPDVLLVPLIGFDRQGNRLGQGGGFYDRTLALLRAQRSILAIGLAYAVQQEPMIPVEAHDAPLDVIVTEKACFRSKPE